MPQARQGLRALRFNPRKSPCRRFRMFHAQKRRYTRSRCITPSKIKGYPFEVAVVVKPASVVLSDQVRSLDWRMRNAKLKGKVSAKEIEAVRQHARLLAGRGKQGSPNISMYSNMSCRTS
ncbi:MULTISPECIES: type II toxin-antitoxin system PemK/MazF family toxin [Komagataeibacter]|uniref:type II toxin-antitoxin system PemK/MazF family toxin n=2 Tax=Komagataeibacter TaxID=1434011 RepID=UPI00308438D4